MMPSAALARSKLASGSVEPLLRCAAMPTSSTSKSSFNPNRLSAWRRIDSVASTISGPMSSPGRTAIFIGRLFLDADGADQLAHAGVFALHERRELVRRIAADLEADVLELAAHRRVLERLRHRR